MSNKKKLSCDVDEEFLEEVKDTVVFLQGKEPQTTFRSFVEKAVRSKIEHVKKKYKKKKIPSRHSASLRKGRRLT